MSGSEEVGERAPTKREPNLAHGSNQSKQQKDLSQGVPSYTTHTEISKHPVPSSKNKPKDMVETKVTASGNVSAVVSPPDSDGIITNVPSILCETCNEQHDGRFGAGRFCSISCSKESHGKPCESPNTPKGKAETPKSSSAMTEASHGKIGDVNFKDPPLSEEIPTPSSKLHTTTIEKIPDMYRQFPPGYRQYLAPNPSPTISIRTSSADKQVSEHLPPANVPSQTLKYSGVEKKNLEVAPKNIQAPSQPTKDTNPITRNTRYPQRIRTPRKKYQDQGGPFARKPKTSSKNIRPRHAYGAAPKQKYSQGAFWAAPRSSAKKPEADVQQDPDVGESSSDEQIEEAIKLYEENREIAIQWEYDFQKSLNSKITHSEKEDLCKKVVKLPFLEMKYILSIVAKSLNRYDLLNDYEVDFPIDDLDNKTIRRIQHLVANPYGYQQSMEISSIEYNIRSLSTRLELRRAGNRDSNVGDSKIHEDLKSSPSRDPRRTKSKDHLKKKEQPRCNKRDRSDVDSSDSEEHVPPKKTPKQKSGRSFRYNLRSQGGITDNSGNLAQKEDLKQTKSSSESEQSPQNVDDLLASVSRNPIDGNMERGVEVSESSKLGTENSMDSQLDIHGRSSGRTRKYRANNDGKESQAKASETESSEGALKEGGQRFAGLAGKCLQLGIRNISIQEDIKKNRNEQKQDMEGVSTINQEGMIVELPQPPKSLKDGLNQEQQIDLKDYRGQNTS